MRKEKKGKLIIALICRLGYQNNLKRVQRAGHFYRLKSLFSLKFSSSTNNTVGLDVQSGALFLNFFNLPRRLSKMQPPFFLIALILQPYLLSASPTHELDVSGEVDMAVATAPLAADQVFYTGYECGNTFFTDTEVGQVLWNALAYVDRNEKTALKYHGPLYDDAESSEYLLWSIGKGKIFKMPNSVNSGAFSIVFRRDSRKVIDIISRISNCFYTKCIRIDSSQAGPSTSIHEITNGYQCGHDFLSDHLIMESVGYAKDKIEAELLYPAPYVGRLYPPFSQYLIWPIFARKKIYKNGYGKGGPYYIVISGDGALIDAVVRGFHNNFLRCIRSRKGPRAPTPDPYSKFFVPSLISGYQCGKYFFDDEHLIEAASAAKNNVRYNKNYRFPEMFNGHPINELCLLWPLVSDRSLYTKGNGGPYRVVLTPDYKVKTVAIVENHVLKVCEKRMLQDDKKHDTSDYLCGNVRLRNDQLIRAAGFACEKLNSKRLNFYPARYIGPGFDKDGPYVTYPVFKKSDFKMNPGLNRVVMNFNCEVVGALTTLKTNGRKRLVKCYRMQDGPASKGYLQQQNEDIFESRNFAK